jgi:exosortase
MNDKTKTMIKFASCVALLLIAYIPTILWMLDRWFEKESYYGHGFLIPLVSLFIAWQRRGLLRRTWDEGRGTRDEGRRTNGWGLGVGVVAVGLLVHIVCAGLKVYFISGFSFVFVFYGLILFFFGKDMTRKLTFPIFFLFAMVPLPLVMVSNLTVQLKLFAAQCATFILNRIGFPSVRDGSTIIMPNSYIAVEAPCSGLRSLISLLTLGLIFAYAMKMSYLKKAVLFLSSVPIALGTNIMRILLLAAVNDLYGEKVAMGFIHDFSGFLVFAVAFAALLGVGRVLEGRG